MRRAAFVAVVVAWAAPVAWGQGIPGGGSGWPPSIGWRADDDLDGIPNYLDEGSALWLRWYRGSDMDLDGIPNRYDADRDDDGLVNAYDPHPHIPASWGAAGLAVFGNPGPVFMDGSEVIDEPYGPPPVWEVHPCSSWPPEWSDSEMFPCPCTEGAGDEEWCGCEDGDEDGIPDIIDPDAECYHPYHPAADPDEDGVPNYLDLDDDGDGCQDECDPDHPNYQPNLPACEGTLNEPGHPCYDPDHPLSDPDGDGIVNEDDDDDDGDGCPDECDTDHPDYDPDLAPDDCDCEDTDGDGITDGNDLDDDGDGCADVCDTDHPDYDPAEAPDYCDCDRDTDGDGIKDTDDPDDDNDGIPDDDDIDDDGDGVPDYDDPDHDSDDDGVPDGEDDDDDNDGIPDDEDDDDDGDGIPDDDDPDHPDGGGGGGGENDADGDGVPDGEDNCVTTPNPGQGDLDGDGVGDVCDDDVDGDGVHNDDDNCLTVFNPGQEDADGDGIGDICDQDDDDWDNDGVLNGDDNCPYTFNPGQLDSDGDGVGDACDDEDGDWDEDGIPNDSDNCPFTWNPSQTDTDGDGIGDACDDDPSNPGDGTGGPCCEELLAMVATIDSNIESWYADWTAAQGIMQASLDAVKIDLDVVRGAMPLMLGKLERVAAGADDFSEWWDPTYGDLAEALFALRESAAASQLAIADGLAVLTEVEADTEAMDENLTAIYQKLVSWDTSISQLVALTAGSQLILDSIDNQIADDVAPDLELIAGEMTGFQAAMQAVHDQIWEINYLLYEHLPTIRANTDGMDASLDLIATDVDAIRDAVGAGELPPPEVLEPYEVPDPEMFRALEDEDLDAIFAADDETTWDLGTYGGHDQGPSSFTVTVPLGLLGDWSPGVSDWTFTLDFTLWDPFLGFVRLLVNGLATVVACKIVWEEFRRY
jgi:hypothetical protein